MPGTQSTAVKLDLLNITEKIEIYTIIKKYVYFLQHNHTLRLTFTHGSPEFAGETGVQTEPDRTTCCFLR